MRPAIEVVMVLSRKPSVKMTKSIPLIEFMRFVAAFLVLTIHTDTIQFQYGGFGVDLFFMISGFVMMYSTQYAANGFFLKRLIRVVPIYWLCTFGLFVIALILPSLLKATTADPVHLFKSLFFIPFDKNGVGHFPILSVGWTLNFEMYFYLIFWISLGLSHKYRDLIATGLIVSVYGACRIYAEGIPFSVYGDPYVYEFILGMLSFRLIFPEVRDRRIIGALVAILTLSLVLDFEVLTERVFSLGFVIFAIFLISMIVAREKSFPPIVSVLGGSSYALYLTHEYVLQIILIVFPPLGHSLIVDALYTLIALPSAVGIGILVYHYFEKRVTKALRMLLLLPRRPQEMQGPQS